jgi:outer membrane protein, multidrug efflux system
MRKRTIILPILTTIVVLAGCTLIPAYHKPDEKLPDKMGEKQAQYDASLDKWWLRFNDPALDSLIDKALADNTDLLQAYGRINQTLAALGIAKADYLPSLSVGSSNYRQDTATGLRTSLEGPDPVNVFYQYGMLSYELDLFGRIRSSARAAKQDLLATDYAAKSLRSLVAANTAITYFNLVASREELRITEASVATRKHTLKIQEERFKAGYGSDSERQQALAELANAEVTIPDLKNAIESYQSALRILVGCDASEIWNAKVIHGVPTALPEPPVVSWDVVPASVLENRPDIMAAEAELKAANDRIGVARAQRWPTLSIGAVFGTADTKTDNLFTNYSSTWKLSGDAAMPVFDFGRNKNRVKSARAAAEIAEINYRAVVRNAFGELRNAATASDLSAQSVAARMNQVEAWNKSYAFAESRYKTGYADPLEILDSERGQFAAQLALVGARRDRLVAAVNLCRALGGGWRVDEKDEVAKK